MERKEKHIDEGTLHAWLDGALTPEESTRVEAHVAACAACGAAAAEARGLMAAASRILTALDDVPGGVAPGGRGAGSRTSASTERRRRLWTGWPLRAAAAVLFVVAGSLAVIQQMGVGVRHYETPSARAIQAPARPEPDTAVPVKKHPLVTPPVTKEHPAARERHAEVAKATPPVPAASVQPAPVPPAPASEAAPQAQAMDDRRADSAAKAPHTVTITGRVVSATTGEPVPQAVVQLTNSSISAATNDSGQYVIPIPAGQATGQPAQLNVRRLGFERKIDSVTVAQAAPTDTVHRDIALAPATLTLSQMVVTGTGKAAAKSAAKSAVPSPKAAGCYTIDAAGLPSRIELGERLLVLPPDSAAFPTASWTPVSRIAVRIVLTDTSGTTREIEATIVSQGLQGSVTRSDSASVAKPFVAMRTGPSCQ